MNKLNIKYGFAFKLSLYVIPSIIIIFLFVLFYNYYITRSTILDDIESYMLILASSVIDKMENGLSAAQQTAEDLAYVFEHTNPTKDEINNLFQKINESNEQIYGLFIACEPYTMNKTKYYYCPYSYERPKGRISYIDLGENKYDYFKKSWYTIPKNENKKIWTEPYFDEKTGVNIVAYSCPFYKTINGKRKFSGVIVCEITIDRLIEYVSEINLRHSGVAFLISNKGTYLSHKDKNVVKESIFSIANKYNLPALAQLGEKMIKKETGVSHYYSSFLKKECIVSYTPLETTGWSLAIVIPKDEIFSRLNSITLKLFLMGLLGYFLSLLFIIILARKITIPLRNLANATYEIGKGNFTVNIPDITTTDEIGILSGSFRSMQDNLKKYIVNLKETTATKERIEKELSIAREIQQSIVPTNFPDIKQFDIYTVLNPAREVGGDLYDFFFIDDKHFCFAIGDVSGKGVPAALFMAIIRTLLRAKVSLIMEPELVLTAMSDELYKENKSSMFVTLFLGVLDIETGVLEYCNAGHSPPLIHTAQKGFYYFHTEKPYPPLGIVSDVNYKGNKIKLLSEDILFLYTDGITEAMNVDNIQFSEEKLLKVLTDNKDENVVNIANKVMAAVESHASGIIQSDDIAILILK